MTMANHSGNNIPAVLTDYLREAVEKNPTAQTIRLIPTELGWSSVQDIFFETMAGAIVKRRLFGFTPIRALLHVVQDDNRLEFVSVA